MIRPGALGAFARLPFRLIVDATGAAVPGYAFAAGDVKALIAGAWVNVGAQVVELGGAGLGNGGYAVELTAAQTTAALAAGSKIHYYLLLAGHADQYLWEDIEASSATATAIRDAILDYTLRPGRTLRGHWRRMDALFFGRITGFLAAVMTAFRPGGAVAEFSANQDVAGGTRQEVDVTGSEAP